MTGRRLLVIECGVAVTAFLVMAAFTINLSWSDTVLIDAIIAVELLVALIVAMMCSGRMRDWSMLVLQGVDVQTGIMGAALGVAAATVTTLAGAAAIPMNGLTSTAIVGVIVISPVVEELVFRGYVLWSVERAFGARNGLIVSTALFGLAHLPSGAGALITACAMGMLFAWLTIRSRSLLPGLAAHMAFNSTQVLVAVIPHLVKH